MAVAAAANALITTTEVKRWLNLDGSGDDDFLQEAINDWSDAVETRCGRIIKQATYTDEAHDGGKKAVLLLHPPVSSITSITVDDDELESDEYVYDEKSGIVRMVSGYAFEGVNGEVTVTYVGGYDPVPGDLKRAMMQLAALEYYLSGRGRKALAKRGESMGNGSVSYERGPQDQEKIMKEIERRYKRR
jgi:uncharacterized phiE125 gp8 family phage protein